MADAEVLSSTEKEIFKDLYHMAVMYWNPNSSDEYWAGMIERQHIIRDKHPLGAYLSRALANYLTDKYEETRRK